MFRLRNQTIEGKKKKENRSYFVMLTINTQSGLELELLYDISLLFKHGAGARNHPA